MSWKPCWTLILFLSFSSFLRCRSEEISPSQSEPIKFLLSEIGQSTGLIESFLVRYRIDYNDPPYPQGYYLERTVALKRPHFAYHGTAHGDATISADDDPFRLSCLMNGDLCVTTRIHDRTFIPTAIKPTDPLVGSFPGELALWVFGVWPLTDRPPPRLFSKYPYMLSDYSRSLDTKDTSCIEEVIDGVPCWMMDRPGLDRLWIDPKRNYAVVRREIKREGTESISRRFVHLEHTEIIKGVWLPKAVIDYNNLDSSPSLPVRMDILEYRVNDLDSDWFDFAILPGAVKWENERLTQADPRTDEHFHNVVRIGAQLVKASPQRASWQPKHTALCTIVFAWILLEVAFAKRRWVRRTSSGYAARQDMSLPNTAS